MRKTAVLDGVRVRDMLAPTRSSQYRHAVLAVAIGMFVAVTLLRWYVDRSGQAAALLYVVPIAVIAVFRGRRAGSAAATLGVALFSLFVLLHGNGDLDFTGWMAPILSMCLVGGLLGDLSERASEKDRAALVERERRYLVEEFCGRQEDALEVTDLMVQGVAAAKWMMEMGHTVQALESLTSTVEDSMSRLSDALPRPRGIPARQPASLRCDGVQPTAHPSARSWRRATSRDWLRGPRRDGPG